MFPLSTRRRTSGAEELMTSEQSRRQTVLIVEDDAMLRGILAEYLVEEGFAVLTAEDGEQALAIASTLEGQLDLVVTDVLLPVMDGLELADRLAHLEPPPPVLFISGVTAERNVPGPVLAKPFGPSAFLEQVGRVLASVTSLLLLV
jgi:two-component system, cell cycle sensor histidine kinase and response regulator CckA